MRTRLALLAVLTACSVPDHDYTAAVDSTVNADASIDASPSMLAVSPGGDLALGDVIMGQSTAKTTITVVNNGGMDSGSIELTFDDTTLGFTIADDTCSGHPLAPAHTCTFAVQLTPTQVGAAAATLNIGATPGGDLTKQVTGNSITQGQVDIVEASYDYTVLGIDAAPLTKTFTIRNIGQAAMGMALPSTANGDASYAIQSTTCTTPLATGDTCTVTVAFDPSSVGQKAGSLTVTASPGGQDVATLSGTGTAHVSVSTTGSGQGIVLSTQTGIDCGSTCAADFSASPVTLNAQAALGSTFAGWGIDCAGMGSCALDLTGAKTVTASFSINNYNLTVTKAGNGTGSIATVTTPSVTGTSCGANCVAYPYQTMVTLTPTTANGSHFTGWSGDCSGMGNCSVTMDQLHNATATFTLDRFSLGVVRSGTGTGSVVASVGALNCGTTCQDDYNYNTQLTLTATAAQGSNFSGWTNCPSPSGNTCTITMTAGLSVTADFTLGQYALTVSKTGSGTVTSTDGNINCGSGAGCTHSYTYNASVTLTATPALGQAFDHWTTGPCINSTSASCPFTMPAAQTAATAAFITTKQDLTVVTTGSGQGTVTSNPSGISCPGACTKQYDYNSVVVLTAAPLNGASVGWSNCDSVSGLSCTVTVTAARTVTANFAAGPQTLVVTIGGNGAGTVTSTPAAISCPSTCSSTFTFNQSVTLAAAPQGAATFIGWSGDCTGQTCTLTMNQPHNVTATFSAGDQTLNLTSTGTGAGTFNVSPAPVTVSGTTYTYHYNQSVQITAAPNSTSTFGGWTGACAGQGNPCTVTMDQARSATATFTLVTKRLQLSYASPNGGTGNVTPNPVGAPCGTRCWDYTYNTTVTLTASPDAGSSFNGWSTCTGLNQCNVVMIADVPETATFVTNYTLIVTNNGDGIGTVAGAPAGITNAINCSSGSSTNCSAEYPGVSPPTPVTLTATPNGNSIFTGWGGACSGNASCTVSMSGASSVTATFARVYSLTATTTGAGSITQTSGIGSCGTNCTKYQSGTPVSLTVQPNGGNYFANWTGDCAGQLGTTCTLTMGADHTATANFLPYNALTIVRNGAGRVTSNDSLIDCGTTTSQCNANYPPAQTVTLTGTANVGSTFYGWSGGGCTGTAPCTVTMDQARSVTAAFYYNVNLAASPASGGSISSSSGGISCALKSGFSQCIAYSPGTSIVVQHTEQPGYAFNNWTGGTCSGNSTCTPTVNASIDVTANFQIQSYPLVISLTNNNVGNNSVTGSGLTCTAGSCQYSIQYNSTVFLNANPDPNTGRFARWTSGPCAGTTNQPCAVTMPVGGAVVGAQFDWYATMTIRANAGGYLTKVSSGESPKKIDCTNTSNLTGTCTAIFTHNTTVMLTYSGGTWSNCHSGNGETLQLLAVASGDCTPPDGDITGAISKACSFTFSSPGDYTSEYDVSCQ